MVILTHWQGTWSEKIAGQGLGLVLSGCALCSHGVNSFN